MSGAHRPAARAAARLRDLRWPARHRGDANDFLARHAAQAKHWLKRGASGARKLAPELFYRITDERSLWLAWGYLGRHGGQAPGPDGLLFGDAQGPLRWQACRALRDDARCGSYAPSLERVLWIDKGPGRGKRPLIIQSILDRIVQRSCTQILQPVIDPLFDARSFGYRPKKSHLHALALAEHLAHSKGLWSWVAVDIKSAFNCVPLKRLLDIVGKPLPDEELVNFLKVILSGSKQPGLRQGGPLSPMLLNIYLHHLLDAPWRDLHPHLPLLRYADDVL